MSAHHHVWFVLQPAEDVPGCWVAHCLEWDLVTQGDSPAQAYENCLSVVSLILKDDHERGVSVWERKPAPEVYWQERDGLLQHGERIPLGDALGSPDVAAIAGTLTVQRGDIRVQQSVVLMRRR